MGSRDQCREGWPPAIHDVERSDNYSHVLQIREGIVVEIDAGAGRVEGTARAGQTSFEIPVNEKVDPKSQRRAPGAGPNRNARVSSTSPPGRGS
jgi:hypothetical protein